MNDYCEHQSEVLCDTHDYKEMEYRLQSLRSLVCDLLKTNQELRDALLDAGIVKHGREAIASRATPPAEVKPLSSA
jgi:hypothetical protein